MKKNIFNGVIINNGTIGKFVIYGNKPVVVGTIIIMKNNGYSVELFDLISRKSIDIYDALNTYGPKIVTIITDLLGTVKVVL